MMIAALLISLVLNVVLVEQLIMWRKRAHDALRVAEGWAALTRIQHDKIIR